MLPRSEKFYLLVSFIITIIATPGFGQGKQILKLQKDFAVQYSNKPDSIKVKAIYDWIASNIDYDFDLYLTGDHQKIIKMQDPDVVIKRQKAVCDGYSQLFNALCASVDIPSIQVTGIAGNELDSKSRRSQRFERHAWNLARVDGNWALFDPTWGAGYIDVKTNQYVRKVDYKYFQVDPIDFLQTHYSFDPLYQMVDQPISKKDFTENRSRENSNSVKNINQNIDLEYSLPEPVRIRKSLDRRIDHDKEDVEAIFQLSYYLQTEVDTQMQSIGQKVINDLNNQLDGIKYRNDLLEMVEKYDAILELLKPITKHRSEYQGIAKANYNSAKQNKQEVERLLGYIK
jgi:hypothetical protein